MYTLNVQGVQYSWHMNMGHPVFIVDLEYILFFCYKFFLTIKLNGKCIIVNFFIITELTIRTYHTNCSCENDLVWTKFRNSPPGLIVQQELAQSVENVLLMNCPNHCYICFLLGMNKPQYWKLQLKKDLSDRKIAMIKCLQKFQNVKSVLNCVYISLVFCYFK